MHEFEAQTVYSAQITERLHSPESSLHETVIRDQFDVLKRHVNLETGLWPAVEPGVGKKEAYEADHMGDAWIRDTSMNLIGLIETAALLKRLHPEGTSLGDDIRDFVKIDIERLLSFLTKDPNRWFEKFRQGVLVNEKYSCLIDPKYGGLGAPEVHLKANGDPCPWERQNQPDSWGELLIALGRAKATGIIKEYTKDELDQEGNVIKVGQTTRIKQIAGYLCRIQPWNFECSGMWEDPEVKAPTSRSTALIIIKGLKAIRDVVKGDQIQADIHVALRRTMKFIKEDPYTDRTSPDHGDGADFAMAIAEAMPSTERTRMPADKYISDNAERLSIGVFPAGIRHLYDRYFENPKVAIREARWFISNPTLVIDYAQAARLAMEEGEITRVYEPVAEHFKKSVMRFKQTVAVLDHYEYAPELFIPTDPECVNEEDLSWVERDPNENVLLVPLQRSLLWNRAFIAWAAAENLFTRHRIEALTRQIDFPPGFFDLD